MIDDGHRGYIMELMATKLLSMGEGLQVVGMSATFSVDLGTSMSSTTFANASFQNIEILAKWLDAKYYESKYRPIPVQEFLVCDNSAYSISTSGGLFRATSQLTSTQLTSTVPPQRTIEPSEYIELQRPVLNSVVALAVETFRAGYGALVFCSSRAGCQATASLICEAMPTRQEVDQNTLSRRIEVLTSLRSIGALDEVLSKTIVQGVAFHRESSDLYMCACFILSSETLDAGLTTEERNIIADAYDQGIVKIIVATCSLAAGINLPARRVILQGARMGRDLIGPAML